MARAPGAFARARRRGGGNDTRRNMAGLGRSRASRARRISVRGAGRGGKAPAPQARISSRNACKRCGRRPS